MVDYQRSYAPKRGETMYSPDPRLPSEMESSRQRAYKRTLLNFKSLQAQLQSVHDEARQRNDKIQAFLATFLPEFNNNDSNSNSNSNNSSPQETRTPSNSVSPPPPSSFPPPPPNISSPAPNANNPPPPPPPPPPTPKVEYEWGEASLQSSSYHFLTRSNPFRGRVDELKLCLRFDVDSRQLPNKIQLEVTDPKTGRVIFKKRQNIYYVKLQERISVLDSGEDYNLEIKTVSDSKDESVENVTIYSREHLEERKEEERRKEEEKEKELAEEEEEEEEEERSKEEISEEDSGLESALQEFVEEARFLEAKPRSPVEEESTAPTQHQEQQQSVAKKTSCIVLKHPSPPPSPPPPEISESPTPAPPTPTPSVSSSSTSNGLGGLVLSLPASVPSVRYRWQKGFRKAQNGRYIKVPILRLAFRFEDRRHQLLPAWLDLRADSSSSSSNNNSSSSKRCSVAGREGTCELQLDDSLSHSISVVGGGLSGAGGGGEGRKGHSSSSLGERDSATEAKVHLMPEFLLKVDSAGPSNSNQWRAAGADVGSPECQRQHQQQQQQQQQHKNTVEAASGAVKPP